MSPGKRHPHEEASDVHVRDRSEDDDHHRGRDDGAEGAARADGAGDEPLVVGVAQHHRDREQSDHRLGRPDHPARGREDDAQDHGADREAPGEPPGPEMDRLEQAFRDAGSLHERAHEDEERHRSEHVGGRDLVDLLREHVDRGEREVEADCGEDEGHREKRERDREAQEDEQHQGWEHPQSELHAHAGPSNGHMNPNRPASPSKPWAWSSRAPAMPGEVGNHRAREWPQGELHAHAKASVPTLTRGPPPAPGPGTSRPHSTMTHLTVSTTDCMSSRRKPITKVYLNGQMMGFQADSARFLVHPVGLVEVVPQPGAEPQQHRQQEHEPDEVDDRAVPEAHVVVHEVHPDVPAHLQAPRDAEHEARAHQHVGHLETPTAWGR